VFYQILISDAQRLLQPNYSRSFCHVLQREPAKCEKLHRRLCQRSIRPALNISLPVVSDSFQINE
jgi:hypothetical protein